MGSTKLKLEGISKKGKEVGREGIDAGSRILGEGIEISNTLGSIDLSIDEEDKEAVEEGKQGYKSDLGAAYGEQAETLAERAGEQLSEAGQQSEIEKEKVEDAARKFEQAGSVSDIGKSNAESAARSLENSADYYENLAREAMEAKETIKEKVGEMRNELDGLNW